ncbi:MAG: zinc ribbon domain-containing protein [Methanobacteriota archaeon]|nr:MAG: zinc ribbon domain-containing protein [Euryarchaeota archaeon]
MILDPQTEPQIQEDKSSERWAILVSCYILSLGIGVLTLFVSALDYGNQQIIFLLSAFPLAIIFDVNKIRSYIDPALKENTFFKIKPNPIKFTVMHQILSFSFLSAMILLIFRVVKNLSFQIFGTMTASIPLVLASLFSLYFLYDFLTIHPLKHLMLGMPSWSRSKIPAFPGRGSVFIVRLPLVLFLLMVSINLGTNPIGLATVAFFGSIFLQSVTIIIEQNYFRNAAYHIIEETKEAIPLGVNPNDSKQSWPFLSALGLEDDPMTEPVVPEPTINKIREAKPENPVGHQLINTHIDHPTASKTLQKLIAKVKEEEYGGQSPLVGEEQAKLFLFCMNCGTRNNAINTYCHACGTSLQF